MGRSEGQAQILSQNELKSVILSFLGDKYELRNKAILLLSFKVGLRAKEISAITLEDVLTRSAISKYNSAKLTADLQFNSNDIRETITMRSKVSKGQKIDKAYIRCDAMIDALVDYLPIRRESFQRGDIDNLFLTQKGSCFSPTVMSQLFMSMSKKSGIEFSSHSGRRTLCTNLVHKGVHIFDIQAIMRHSDISTTMLYYQKDERRLGNLMEENQ